MTSGPLGVGVLVAVFAVVPAAVSAQSANRNFELGGHVSVLRLSEFDVADTGVGLTAAWWATPIIALDSSLSWFPGNDGATAFSNSLHRTPCAWRSRQCRSRSSVTLHPASRALRLI